MQNCELGNRKTSLVWCQESSLWHCRVFTLPNKHPFSHFVCAENDSINQYTKNISDISSPNVQKQRTKFVQDLHSKNAHKSLRRGPKRQTSSVYTTVIRESPCSGSGYCLTALTTKWEKHRREQMKNNRLNNDSTKEGKSRGPQLDSPNGPISASPLVKAFVHFPISSNGQFNPSFNHYPPCRIAYNEARYKASNELLNFPKFPHL